MSDFRVVAFGNLIVNLPLVSITILGLYTCSLFEINYRVGLFICLIVCWFMWLKLLKIWVFWAVRHNVTKEKLIQLGKAGFINFSEKRIVDIIENR